MLRKITDRLPYQITFDYLYSKLKFFHMLNSNGYSKEVFDLNYLLVFAYDTMQSGILNKGDLDKEMNYLKVNPDLWKHTLKHSQIIRETFDEQRFKYTWLASIRPNIHMANSLICDYENYLVRESANIKLAAGLEYEVTAATISNEQKEVYRFLNWCYINCRQEKIISDKLLNELLAGYNCNTDTVLALSELKTIRYVNHGTSISLLWLDEMIKPTVELVQLVIKRAIDIQYGNNLAEHVVKEAESKGEKIMKKWTPEMEMTLTRMAHEGRSAEEIGMELERSAGAIYVRLSERKRKSGAYEHPVLGYDVPYDSTVKIIIPLEDLPSGGKHYPKDTKVVIKSIEFVEHVKNVVRFDKNMSGTTIGPASDGTLTLNQDEVIRKEFPLNVDCESTSKAMYEQDQLDAKNNRKNGWTAENDKDLIDCINDGVPIDGIVELFPTRTRNAIMNRVYLLNKDRSLENQLHLTGLKRRMKYGVVVAGSHRRRGEKEWLPLDQPLPKKPNLVVRIIKTIFG